MTRACSICTHPDRDAIDRALAESAPKRRISARYGVTEQAVRRHAVQHLPMTLLRASEATEAARADDLLGTARRVQEEAVWVMEQAKAEGNLGGMLQAIDRVQKGTALLATLLDKRAPENPRSFAELAQRARMDDSPESPGTETTEPADRGAA